MRKIYQKFCHHCCTPFYTRSILTKYCSRKCSNKAFRSKAVPTQAELKRKFDEQHNIDTVDDVIEAA